RGVRRTVVALAARSRRGPRETDDEEQRGERQEEERDEPQEERPDVGRRRAAPPHEKVIEDANRDEHDVRPRVVLDLRLPGCVITERLDDREARGPLCGSVRDRTHQSDGEDGDRDDGVRGEVERIIWRRRRGWSDDIEEEATQPNP